jgi:hypothetical protein
MTEPVAGIGTASCEGLPGLATIHEALEWWAWDRGWPLDVLFRRVRIVADGLAEYMGRLWFACRMRKRHRCTACDRRIRPGSVAYRPLRSGPGVARHARLCSRCVT